MSSKYDEQTHRTLDHFDMLEVGMVVVGRRYNNDPTEIVPLGGATKGWEVIEIDALHEAVKTRLYGEDQYNTFWTWFEDKPWKFVVLKKKSTGKHVPQFPGNCPLCTKPAYVGFLGVEHQNEDQARAAGCTARTL